MTALAFLLLSGPNAKANESLTELSPEILQTVFNAIQNANAGRPKTAIRIYDRALGSGDLSDAESNFLWKYKAKTLVDMGRVDEAIAILPGVRFHGTPSDQQLLRQIYFMLGRWDRYDLSSQLMSYHGTGFNLDEQMHYTSAIAIYVETGEMDKALQVLEAFATAMPDVDMAQETYTASLETQNREAVLLSRIPPMMPSRARRSGECVLSVNINEAGRVSEVTDADCTERVFRKSAEASVKKYLFFPKLVDGQAVPSTQEGLKITYRLADPSGRIIPSR